MLERVKKANKNIDIAIFSAAVADFKTKKLSEKKIKKENLKSILLKKNVDILKTISLLKKNRPKYVVGFSAETGGLINAKKKLNEKNCDMVIYNKISNDNKVFGLNQNKISVITKDKVKNFPKTSKVNCAKQIIDSIYNQIRIK